MGIRKLRAREMGSSQGREGRFSHISVPTFLMLLSSRMSTLYLPLWGPDATPPTLAPGLGAKWPASRRWSRRGSEGPQGPRDGGGRWGVGNERSFGAAPPTPAALTAHAHWRPDATRWRSDSCVCLRGSHLACPRALGQPRAPAVAARRVTSSAIRAASTRPLQISRCAELRAPAGIPGGGGVRPRQCHLTCPPHRSQHPCPPPSVGLGAAPGHGPAPAPPPTSRCPCPLGRCEPLLLLGDPKDEAGMG